MSRKLSRELRGPVSAFAQLKGAATAEGALSTKIKQLMAPAIGITVRCDGCIAYHGHDAIRAGATRQEIMETIGVAILMGGGPARVYACDVLEALDQFEAAGLIPAAASQAGADEAPHTAPPSALHR